MAETGSLTIYRTADQTIRIDVVTETGGSTPQTMTGWALAFVIRRSSDDALVCSKTTGAGITIGNGSGTDDRATVVLGDTDVTHHAGRDYYGALWRTDDGNDTPLWAGHVTILAAAPQP
jgi:hypothetical protein